MADTRYFRMVQKNGSGPATIPPSPSHDTGDWIETDIYENEFYMDNDTRKVYTRVGDAIVLVGVAGKTATAINFADCTVTAPPTENDGDVYILVDGTGSPMDVDRIEFQVGTTHGVRYYFNDFAMMGYGINVGDYFRVQDATNPVHNGTFIITAYDDTAGWIQINNPYVTSAADDEASDSPATAYYTHKDWDGGKPNDVAKFEATTGLWNIVTPEQGDTIILTSDDYEYEFNGSYWESKLKNHINQTGNVHSVQGSQITFADTTISNPLSALDIDAALKELSARGNLYERLANKNSANGYAGLDASTKIPIGLLPDAVLGALKFKGTWDANGDVIYSADLTIDGSDLASIAASAANEGWYFIVFNAGSTNIDGITDWKVGDWVLSIGTLWKKIDNTDAVTSVNGMIGAIVLDTDDITEPGGATNLWFTTARVLATLLTGLSASAGTFTSSDDIITAFGKVKYLIDNFADTVRATVLTGVDITLAGTVAATDTVLEAIGKLQRQAGENSTAFTNYSTFMWGGGRLESTNIAATYMVTHQQNVNGTVSANGTTPPAIIPIVAADYPNIGSKVIKLRIRAIVITNATAPTGSFRVALFPVTPGGGATGGVTHTYGTEVAGTTTATVTTPAASSSTTVVSSDFTLPADGNYALGIVRTGTMATNSSAHIIVQVQKRYNT